jgi:site-specific DNA recombinase
MGSRAAGYARVSTDRQAERQTIEQQVERLQAYAQQQGWALPAEHLYRDDGWSGARLDRPALDRLRDAVNRGDVEVVLITSPDRLARRHAYQVWLLEEFERAGVEVVFLERPLTGDPQDTLVLQIRGAVAEYERYADIGITLVMPTSGLCRCGAAYDLRGQRMGLRTSA